MIDNQTLFNVCDNSGVKYVKCYKISKYLKKKIGTIIFVIVKKTKNSEKLKSGIVTKAVIVRTKIVFNRLNGNFFSFFSNDVILINNKKEFLSTRAFGPLILELRKKQMIKILSLGTKIM